MSPKLRVWLLYPSVLRLARLFAITLSEFELACRPESGIPKDAIELPPCDESY
jgi:hypothetical protein